MEEIPSLILYLLIITFLTLLNFSRRAKPKPRNRYSCRIVDGRDGAKEYF